MTRAALIVAMAAGVQLLGAGQASAAPLPTACTHLSSAMASQPAGPVFLASYPTVKSGPLQGAAFLYDNAVAAIALVA